MVNLLPNLQLIACLNVLLALMLGGCQGSPPSRRLTISAASSLRDALETIEPEFEKRYPQIDLNFNFAASGVLQRQIEQGAPADVFFSAAIQPMNRLLGKHYLVPNSYRSIATNKLVLIVPKDSEVPLSTFKQLQSSQIRRIMVGELTSVPAGQYAQEVFSYLKLYPQIRDKLVFANNVRGVLAAVASANVDAGIVYATDAQQSEQVKSVATAPAHSHSSIVYPIAIMATSTQPQSAQLFIDFLSMPESQATLTQFGFGVVPEE